MSILELIGFILLDIAFILSIVVKIKENKYIPPRRKKIYIIVTCIVPFVGILLYYNESNRRIREKYSSKFIEKKNNIIC